MLSFIIHKYLLNLPCEVLLLDNFSALDPGPLLEELFLLSFPDERESFMYICNKKKKKNVNLHKQEVT